MKHIVIYCLILMLFSGCMSIGNPKAQNENNLSQLQKGVSTQQDVYRLYGQPQTRTQLSNGNQQWHYLHTDVDMSPSTFIPIAGLFIGETNTNSHNLLFTFDRYGVLRDFRHSNSQTQMKGLNQSY